MTIYYFHCAIIIKLLFMVIEVASPINIDKNFKRDVWLLRFIVSRFPVQGLREMNARVPPKCKVIHHEPRKINLTT